MCKINVSFILHENMFFSTCVYVSIYAVLGYSITFIIYELCTTDSLLVNDSLSG